jgi:beta-apo-4'-carotenal oxygenase
MVELIPEYRESSLEAIAPAVARVRQAFNAQTTKPVEFRLVQLRKLYWAYVSEHTSTANAQHHYIFDD